MGPMGVRLSNAPNASSEHGLVSRDIYLTGMRPFTGRSKGRSFLDMPGEEPGVFGRWVQREDYRSIIRLGGIECSIIMCANP